MNSYFPNFTVNLHWTTALLTTLPWNVTNSSLHNLQPFEQRRGQLFLCKPASPWIGVARVGSFPYAQNDDSHNTTTPAQKQPWHMLDRIRHSQVLDGRHRRRINCMVEQLSVTSSIGGFVFALATVVLEAWVRHLSCVDMIILGAGQNMLQTCNCVRWLEFSIPPSVVTTHMYYYCYYYNNRQFLQMFVNPSVLVLGSRAWNEKK